jgi:exopolysaccharide biosynthesis protein
VFVLPPVLQPLPPLGPIVVQSMRESFVAPGVARAVYRLETPLGPLVVHVVAVDPHDRTVRFATILAKDRLISSGETVSSMSLRGDAVAGINGDYFDIGNTNQPLNLVVQDGQLVRTPSKRYALDVLRDGTVRFDTFAFHGSVHYGTSVVPLTTINEWPPEGGATLLTPAYGRLKPAPGVTVRALVPDPASGDASAPTFSAAPFDASAPLDVAGPLLGFGPAALALSAPPQPGDEVTLEEHVDPPLDNIVTAIGGGPLLLKGGIAFEDPFAPAPEERERRFPVSGAATTAEGELLLIAVDGRQPALSIGVTRPEFGALMLALGATDGMAFDSGGSATLVARVLGDPHASVLNSPSDGRERPVADGLFVYSDAPAGFNPRLVVRPDRVVALPGIELPLFGAIVDDAGHFMRSAPLAPLVVPAAPVARTVRIVERGSGYSAPLDLRVVARVARLTVVASPSNPEPGARVTLRAGATTDDGEPVELGDAVRWSSDAGTFESPGVLRAPGGDATIVASAGGLRTTFALRVGSHERTLGLFDPAFGWSFASAPRDGPGSAAVATGANELQLAYDFTAGEKAAYAVTVAGLPGEPIAFSVEIEGDASGVGVRAAFLNRFGERQALTLAQHVDWKGWRTCSVLLPADLNPPVTLVSLYAVPSLGGAPALTRGTLNFRNASVTLPGTR